MFGFSRTRVNSLNMLLQCENLLLRVMILRRNEFYKPQASVQILTYPVILCICDVHLLELK